MLYSRPYRKRLTYDEIKELAAAIRAPHPNLTPESLWRAYETLDRSRVCGSGRRILTDLVSLVRFAMETDRVLRPFTDSVKERFLSWLSEQERLGPQFSEEQRLWLEAIAEHIGGSVSISADDLEETPFSQRGGLARAHQLFGDRLPSLLDELNERLVA